LWGRLRSERLSEVVKILCLKCQTFFSTSFRLPVPTVARKEPFKVPFLAQVWAWFSFGVQLPLACRGFL
jgi:hypothetical protein